MITSGKAYGLSRGLPFRMIFSRKTGFPVGYYNESKVVEGSRHYWVECGYIGCYWESGIHSLELVCDDAWNHASQNHPEEVM